MMNIEDEIEVLMIEGFQNSTLFPHIYFNPEFIDSKKVEKEKVALSNYHYFDVLKKFCLEAEKCMKSKIDFEYLFNLLDRFAVLLRCVPQKYVQAFIQARYPFNGDIVWRVSKAKLSFPGVENVEYLIADNRVIEMFYKVKDEIKIECVDGRKISIQKCNAAGDIIPFNKKKRFSGINQILDKCFKGLNKVNTNDIDTLAFRNPFSSIIRGEIEEDTFNDCEKCMYSSKEFKKIVGHLNAYPEEPELPEKFGDEHVELLDDIKKYLDARYKRDPIGKIRYCEYELFSLRRLSQKNCMYVADMKYSTYYYYLRKYKASNSTK